ncbi:hypothetical protein CEXT_163271 [Caerostris extrusa]|uniref:Transmembrane protein n=1 Tax=Caerostris extrusa TaxID=172846 RepID=A0AAV4T1G1_CAEEX|nr:hypothetical protein CEXT_163271 [Caerostris extrusa]
MLRVESPVFRTRRVEPAPARNVEIERSRKCFEFFKAFCDCGKEEVIPQVAFAILYLGAFVFLSFYNIHLYGDSYGKVEGSTAISIAAYFILGVGLSTSLTVRLCRARRVYLRRIQRMARGLTRHQGIGRRYVGVEMTPAIWSTTNPERVQIPMHVPERREGRTHSSRRR